MKTCLGVLECSVGDSSDTFCEQQRQAISQVLCSQQQGLRLICTSPCNYLSMQRQLRCCPHTMIFQVVTSCETICSIASPPPLITRLPHTSDYTHLPHPPQIEGPFHQHHVEQQQEERPPHLTALQEVHESENPSSPIYDFGDSDEQSEEDEHATLSLSGGTIEDCSAVGEESMLIQGTRAMASRSASPDTTAAAPSECQDPDSSAYNFFQVRGLILFE